MSVSYTRHCGRILVTAAFLTLAACGGGGGGGGGSAPSGGGTTGGTGGGGGGSSGSNMVAAAQLGPNRGQALLGPIVDATVALYAAENFDGVPICTVMSSAEDAAVGPGVIDLTGCAVTPGALYFLVVDGGWDIDANDDGVIDSVRTAKQGTLRALITGQNILDGEFRINIATEIAFQSVSDALLSGGQQLEILSRLDAVARQLLSGDLNGDGIVDNQDLLDYSPVADGSALAAGYGQLLEDILAAIMSGNSGELTNLSRQLLLASLGEYSFTALVSPQVQVSNLQISDFFVENGLIYAAGFDLGTPESDLKVFVFDATDFSAVSLVGMYANENLVVNPQGSKLALLKVGDILYVASQGNGLFVIDVSDPTMPAASLMLDGNYFTHLVRRDDSTLYVSFDDEQSVSNRGVDIVDITDPLNPSIVSTTYGDSVYDMVYQAGLLYVYGPGVVIYDASSPTSLSLLGNLSFAASSDTRVAYANGFIYAPITDAGVGLQGMTIVDVRDPANPQRIDDLAGIGFVRQVDVSGRTLFATTSTSFGSSTALLSFAIGDDGLLQMIDSRSTPTAFYLRYEGGRVYLATPVDLTAYDASALEKTVNHLGFLATDKSANLVRVVGNVAFVGNDTELLAVDVSNPGSALPILGSIGVVDQINDMQIVGSHAFLANANEGIKIVDISDPGNLQVVGSNAELNSYYDPIYDQTYIVPMYAIVLQNDRAYTVLGGYPNARIGVFDVSDPTAPTALFSPAFDRPIDSFVVHNDTLYVVTKVAANGDYYIVDVANEPALVAQLPSNARVIAFDGSYLYTSSANGGLSILDISDPRNPVLFGEAFSLGIGNAISVVGDVAYLANEFGAVEVYDILDKTRPELRGQYPISGPVKDVFATADFVFAVNGYGLIVEPAANFNSALE